MNAKKIIMHSASEIGSVTDLKQFVQELPEAHPDYNNKHGIIIKGSMVKWDSTHPAISGACNNCNTPLSGFAINKGVCRNKFCNKDVNIDTLKKYWFWPKYLLTDINGDDTTWEVFSTHEFAQKTFKLFTDNTVSSVEDYLKILKDGEKYNTMLKSAKSIVIPAVKVVISKRKTGFITDDSTEAFNVSIQLDLP